MSNLQRDSAGLWAKQDKDAFLDYSIDWSDWLVAGDSISSSTWATDPDLTLNSAMLVGTKASVWVQGGVVNKWYAVTNTVVSAQGRRDQRTIRLFITNETDTGSSGSVVFPNRAQAIDSIRRDYLLVAGQTYLSGVQLEDEYIFDKLRAAESYVQHSLRCFLAPTVIVPDDAPQQELDALAASGVRFAQEAAYDYDPDFFKGERWGYIVAKQKPLVSVQSIKLAYPAPSSQVFQIPNEWIRLDRQYGHIRLVPAAMSFSAPLSAFIMQALGGGRTVPFMIQLRYTAGILDVNRDYPELMTTIKRLAVLNVLKDSFTPQSGSISADGLSQSLSADMDKYADSIDRTLDVVREQIHGIRMTVI